MVELVGDDEDETLTEFVTGQLKQRVGPAKLVEVCICLCVGARGSLHAAPL